MKDKNDFSELKEEIYQKGKMDLVLERISELSDEEIELILKRAGVMDNPCSIKKANVLYHYCALNQIKCA